MNQTPFSSTSRRQFIRAAGTTAAVPALAGVKIPFVQSRIFRHQQIKTEDLRWSAPQPEPNPYQLEWDDYIEAVRNNTPYNEVKRGAEISLVTAMGRMAAHTGQIITFDDALNWQSEFAPDVDKLTLDSPAPVRADAEGKYPLPVPGVTKKRVYDV